VTTPEEAQMKKRKLGKAGLEVSAIDDWRRDSPRFQGTNFAKNLELVARVQEIAKEKKVTAGQLALAWVLDQGEDIVPIPGTTKRSHLEENARAVDIVLTPEDLRRIDAVVPRGVATGARSKRE
jgi:aryl-alcohol dehydrogenase-like predicted oxidoreductase